VTLLILLYGLLESLYNEKTQNFYLQQIAIKRVCVQNARTLPELDLVTHPSGRLDLKLL